MVHLKIVLFAQLKSSHEDWPIYSHFKNQLMCAARQNGDLNAIRIVFYI